jgi:hypothetical protein
MHELCARVDAAPSFIPLEGNWRDGLDLLDVPLDEHGVGFALKGLSRSKLSRGSAPMWTKPSAQSARALCAPSPGMSRDACRFFAALST